jgi:hypothetical protein
VTKFRQFSKGQNFFIIMFVLVCGLLFFADGAAFNLISAPLFVTDLISYATLSVAIILTIITLTIVFRDISQGLPFEPQKSEIFHTSTETGKKIRYVPPSTTIQKNPGKVEYEEEDFKNAKVNHQTIPEPVKTSSKKILFITMIVIVVGQLIFANGVAFGLIALPASSIYAAIAGAVALTVITFAIAFKDVQRTSFAKAQKSGAVVPLEESNKAPVTFSQPVNINIQKSTSALELDLAKQKNQSTQPLITQPTKLICPTCRKEFNIPFFEGNLMVDFGPPKQSNLTKLCPHCEAPVPLKRIGAKEEEIWKE